MQSAYEIQICQTCLSSGRKLFLLHKLKDQFDLAMDLQILQARSYDGTETLVCWECSAILQRTVAFRKQAGIAQNSLDTLRDSVQGTMMPKFKSLSRLTRWSDLKEIEITFEEEPSKKESNDSNLKISFYEHHMKEESSDNEFDPIEEYEDHIKTETDITELDTSLHQESKTVKTKAKTKSSKHGSEKIRKEQLTQEEMEKMMEDARSAPGYIRTKLRCESCVLGFHSQKQYKEHMLKHSKVLGPYECDVCSVRACSERELAEHVGAHYVRFHCRGCDYADRHAKCVLRHYRSAHEHRVFACRHCDGKFTSERALRYHRDMAHKAKIKCEHCDKEFQLRPNYKRHLLQHTGMEVVECAVCGGRYRGAAGLRAHHRLQHSARRPPGPTYCRPCDKHFKNAYNYRAHLRTSAKHLDPDKLRYPCPDCDKKFSQECHLKRHYNTIHLRLANFICQFCTKAYCTPQALRMHIKSIHEKRPVARDKVCDVCAKTFTTKTALENHIRGHTGERPFLCPLCPARFARSAALYTHKRGVHMQGRRKRDLQPPAPAPAPMPPYWPDQTPALYALPQT